MRYRILATALLCLSLAACDSNAPPEFEHSMTSANMPWTDRRTDTRDDDFTFAVFSDLTGGERERVFQVAVAQLNLLRPEFIIGVGDLIEGGSEDRRVLKEEWDWFDERANVTKAPLVYVGGNHDLTNAVMRDVFEQRYGARYYHFLYRNALFLVLDTEDYSTDRLQEIYEIRARALARVEREGWEVLAETEYHRLPERISGNVGEQQAAYFRDVIAAHPSVRWTFLFMHKAAWERDGEEHFTSIESALADRQYTVFHGHVHAYRHIRRNDRDYIRLATTGGVQFADRDLSLDQLTLVNVRGDAVDIANLRMSGIFDKTGSIPAGGDELCFNIAECGE